MRMVNQLNVIHHFFKEKNMSLITKIKTKILGQGKETKTGNKTIKEILEEEGINDE